MLRIRYRMRHRNMSKGEGPGSGPQGRISRLRKMVTALVRHERLEGYWDYTDETRGYVERLIQEAMKHGDKHKPTMELADFWLLEKDLIHKLFKVLVPRYQTYSTSFTSFYQLPTVYPGRGIKMGLLELKGNPWPPVVPKQRDVKNSLVNILLEEAGKDYYQGKKSRSKIFDKTTAESVSEKPADINSETESSANTDEISLKNQLNDLHLKSEHSPESPSKDGTPV